MEVLQFGEASAHFPFCLGGWNHLGDECSDLVVLIYHLSELQLRLLKWGAYECAKTTESENPGYAILTVVRGVIIRIVVNLSIDCVEDSAGDESNDELREDDGQIVNAEDRSTCDWLRLLVAGINVVLIVRPPTNKRGTFAVEARTG